MKIGIVIILIVLCLLVFVFVIMLRFLIDVDFLVFDGKKVFSFLLCGVDSIELDNGLYQLVFCVEKMIYFFNSEEWLYIFLLLVVSFNIQFINQVNFCLFCLENEWEVNYFDVALCFELLDGDVMLILVKLDIFVIILMVKMIDYEVEVECYNKFVKCVLLL